MKRTSCVFKKQAMNEEPVCFSRFDYDYKIVQKLVTLEKAYSELKEVNDLLQKEIGSMKKKDIERSVSLYIRRGRTECPGNGTEMVYRGYTAGRHLYKAAGQAFCVFLRNLHGPDMTTAVIQTEVLSGAPR